ncbi:MAG TPA: phosphate starvation-inducible protein PhoH, partial [Polaromonas sp.]|nr:phosphate starvation-inducible protein PhoH [Polaromonas sp.]
DVVRHPLVARIVDAYDKPQSPVVNAESAMNAIDSIAPSARPSRARSRNGS